MIKGIKYTYPITVGEDTKVVYRLSSYCNNKGKRNHFRINKVSSSFGVASSDTYTHWIVWFRKVLFKGKEYTIYKLVRRDSEQERQQEEKFLKKIEATDFSEMSKNMLKIIRIGIPNINKEDIKDE